MNRKTLPVSSNALRRRARVDVQKRLLDIRTDMTDMDMTAMTADYRVLSEDTAPTSSAADADAFDSLEDLSEEDMDFDDGDGTTCSDSEPDVPSPSLSDNIANWAMRFGISMVALTALLSILSITHPNLPKDGRTLLKTKVHYDIQEKAGGNYHHFGILSSLRNTLNKHVKILTEGMTLGLQINVDGLPLFKSSTLQLWPILGLLVTVPMKEPVVIGAYCGPKKPSSATEFLSDFVTELKELEAGFCFGDKNLTIELHTVVCDTPARAFVKKTKAHNAYHGCDKCQHPGKYQNHRMSFPGPEHPLRTDMSFNLKLDEIHHHEGPHPFQGIKIGMVTQFPLDYMHLVCLGVVKKMLQFWLRGPLTVRMPALIVDRMSHELQSVRPNVPVEFARRPRSLRELDRWKATEFRQFLLYTGPVVLAGFLDQNMYSNFMLLSTAISILVSPQHHSLVDYAGQLLKSFVAHFGELYGTDQIVYNVHCLVHLADEVNRHGCLDTFSAFPYENYLGKIKKLVRKPEFPLAQLVRRLSEVQARKLDVDADITLKREHFVGPIVVGMGVQGQYGEMRCERWTVKLSTGDNIFLVGEKVCLVKNIIQNDNGVFIVYTEFSQQSPFYTYPFNSDRINIFVVNHASDELKSVEVSALRQKCVALPYRDGFVAIPLLH